MSEEYAQDHIIRDMADAMQWVDEALSRLRTELDCMSTHWDVLVDADQIQAFDITQEEAVNLGAHIYALINHAREMPKYFGEVSRLLLEWVAPDAVKEQIAQDFVEQMTGVPHTAQILPNGMVALIPQDVTAPDDLSELDGMMGDSDGGE